MMGIWRFAGFWPCRVVQGLCRGCAGWGSLVNCLVFRCFYLFNELVKWFLEKICTRINGIVSLNIIRVRKKKRDMGSGCMGRLGDFGGSAGVCRAFRWAQESPRSPLRRRLLDPRPPGLIVRVDSSRRQLLARGRNRRGSGCEPAGPTPTPVPTPSTLACAKSPRHLPAHPRPDSEYLRRLFRRPGLPLSARYGARGISPGARRRRSQVVFGQGAVCLGFPRRGSQAWTKRALRRDWTDWTDSLRLDWAYWDGLPWGFGVVGLILLARGCNFGLGLVAGLAGIR